MSRTDRPPSACDIAVAGGGILGLAVARELAAREPDARIILLEAEDKLAAHQSSHNSGVVHAGVYYEPGSLRARLCVEGAAQLAEYGLLGNLSADTLNNAIASAPYLLASYLDVAEAIRASKVVLDDNRQQFSAGEWYFVESAWTDAKAVNGYVVSRLGLAGDDTAEDAQRQQMMRDALELLPSVIQLGIALAK